MWRLRHRRCHHRARGQNRTYRRNHTHVRTRQHLPPRRHRHASTHRLEISTLPPPVAQRFLPRCALPNLLSPRILFCLSLSVPSPHLPKHSKPRTTSSTCRTIPFVKTFFIALLAFA